MISLSPILVLMILLRLFYAGIDGVKAALFDRQQLTSRGRAVSALSAWRVFFGVRRVFFSARVLIRCI